MTTPAQPVLDYASPRSHGQTRLPATSLLAFAQSADGRSVVVRETLAGQGAAVAAIVFSALSMALLVSVAHATGSDPGFLTFTWLTSALVAGLGLAVINNTWRQTVLAADPDGLRLTFRSPLLPKRAYAWRGEQLHVILPIRLPESTDDGQALGELEIVPYAAPHVRLFTAHLHSQVCWIANSIQLALSGGGEVREGNSEC